MRILPTLVITLALACSSDSVRAQRDIGSAAKPAVQPAAQPAVPTPSVSAHARRGRLSANDALTAHLCKEHSDCPTLDEDFEALCRLCESDILRGAPCATTQARCGTADDRRLTRACVECQAEPDNPACVQIGHLCN